MIFPRYLIVELDFLEYPFGLATVIGHCNELTDFVSNDPRHRLWFDDSPVALSVGDRVSFGVTHLLRMPCAA